MSVDRDRRAVEIFEAVCDLSAGEMAAQIRELCDGDEQLQQLVQRMVDLDDADGSEGHIGAGIGGEYVKRSLAADRGTTPNRIGRYEIIREIGRGGMGVVYEAAQEAPSRRVALKVIRSDYAAPEIAQRFRRESELLGRLEHPGIAQIFEAGTDESGVAFFAMELVEGPPLDVYLREQRPTRGEIVRLFESICDAIQHAHQKGVIHRDLKPANVLIRTPKTGITAVPATDGTSRGTTTRPTSSVGLGPMPKLLDFGVARLMDTDIEVMTLNTQPGQLIGTPAYMSPEQLDADPSAVDARSDTYAVGVMLYHALSGRMPFDIAGRPLTESMRILRESSVTQIGSIDRSLRGDLETIVATAMERDPKRRYASVAALGDDLRRYRLREPIAARPASAMYQLSRLAARHRTAVGGIVATFVALLVGLIGMIFLYAEATRQRETATIEAQRAGRVAELMTDMLGGVKPSLAMGRDVTVLRDILDRAAAALDESDDEFPDVEATMRETIADILLNIAEPAEAARHIERAIALRALIGDELAIARAGLLKARLERQEGRYEVAEALFREHGGVLAASLGPAHPETIATEVRWGLTLTDLSRFDDAIGLLEETLDQARVARPGTESVADVLDALAITVEEAGDLERAEAYHCESLAIYEAVLDPDHPSITASLVSLGLVQNYRGNFAEAERTLTRAIEAADLVLGPDHPQSMVALNNLGGVRYRLGDSDGALEITADILERRRRIHGLEHPLTANAMNNHAFVLLNTGDVETAESMYREVLEIRIALFGERHADVAHSIGEIAWTLLQRDMVDEAADMYDRALTLRLELHGEEVWHVPYMRTWLGECRRRQSRLEEAEALLRQAVAGYESLLGPDHFRTAAARIRLGETLLDAGEPAESMELLSPAYDTYLQQRGPDHPSVVSAAALIERAETDLSQQLSTPDS
ncbi:MAG: serine/threonine-protein kinase [Planctomycetota bacterium]